MDTVAMNAELRLTWILICAAAIAGCGQNEAPLAGGKTIGHWIQAAGDPNVEVRLVAITKLGNAGNADPEVLPTLTAALKDRDAHVRREAIVAIFKYGPGAEPAADALAIAQNTDPNPKVREYASRALQKMRNAGGR
jgi:HEAT repeat protein